MFVGQMPHGQKFSGSGYAWYLKAGNGGHFAFRRIERMRGEYGARLWGMGSCPEAESGPWRLSI